MPLGVSLRGRVGAKGSEPNVAETQSERQQASTQVMTKGFSQSFRVNSLFVPSARQGPSAGVVLQRLRYRETQMPAPRDFLCPGSGRQMVARTYVIRRIEDSDRLNYERRVKSAEARA